MAQQFSISAIFKLIDEATKPAEKIASKFRSIGKSLDELVRPTRKAGDIFASHIGKLATSAITTLWKWAKRAVLAVIAIGTAATYAFLRFTQMTFQLSKAAERLGISTNDLQLLRLAAEQTGMEVGELDVAFRFFIKAIGEARIGVGEGKKAFEALRIGLRKGNKEWKTGIELFWEIADKMSKMTNQELKAAAASRLFTRAGANMLNMLQWTKKEWADFAKKAELGIIPKDVVKEGSQFTMQLLLIKRMLVGLLSFGLRPILPVLNELLKNLSTYLVKNKDIIKLRLEKWGKNFAESIKKLPDILSRIAEEMKIIIDYVRELSTGDLGIFFKWLGDLTGRTLDYLTRQAIEREILLEKTRAIQKKKLAEGRPFPGVKGLVLESSGALDIMDKFTKAVDKLSSSKSKVEIGINTAPGLFATVNKIDKGGMNLDVFTSLYLGYAGTF